MASKKRTSTANGNQGSKWCPRWFRLACYIRDGFACAYCGRDLKDAEPREVTLDHLKCRAHGGDDSSRNVVTACLRCNSARGAKPWRQYATGGAIDRIESLRRRKLNEKLAKAILRGEAGDPRVEAAR
jgi:5-methylcytosine-specific restriction endonuclease McrA